MGQLKELLNRTGTLVEEGFWIDKIKSHCYVTVGLFPASLWIFWGNFFFFFIPAYPFIIFPFPQYSSTEEAMATRTALHGVKWPQSNPKFLSVDFCTQEEVKVLFHLQNLISFFSFFMKTNSFLVHPIRWTSTGVWVQQEKSHQKSPVGRQPLDLAVRYPRLSCRSATSGQNERGKWKGGRDRVQKGNGTEIR